MPNPPLIDLANVDLSRTVFDAHAVQRHCKQRGTFALLDGVLHFDRERELSIGFKDLGEHDWWAKDHIPGRPIFPGVLQCEGAAQLATFDFLERRPELAGTFLGFVGLDAVRFRGLITPPARLVWVVNCTKVRRGMFVYAAQGFVANELVFECDILGMAM